MKTESVGRDQELAEIAAFVEDVAAGLGATLVIEGEPGIGKTHLLEVAVASAEAASIRVLRSTARETERDLPFAAILEALRPEVRKQVANMIPEEPKVEPELRFRLLEFVLDKLEEELVVAPTLVVIDDFHWTDPATLAVVQRVTSASGLMPLGLAIAVRPFPRTQELGATLAELSKQARHLKLEALTRDEVERLGEATIGARLGPRLLGFLQECGGNPLYVLAVLAAAETEIVRKGGIAEAENYQPSASLYGIITERLTFLSEETISLLRAGAALGTRFEVGDLAIITARTTDETLRLITPAAQVGILSMEGSEVRFRHDLVRDALYESIPEAARPAMHGDIARVLDAAGRPPSSIAPHLLASAQAGHSEALSLLRQTAAEAAPRAPTIAADLLERAVNVAGRKHPDRYAIEAEWSRALMWAGRASEAERIARRLLGEARGEPVEAIARRVLLDALFLQGRLAESLAEVEMLAASAAASDERAALLARAARAFVESGDLERGEQLARQALGPSEELHDDASLSVALSVLARVAFIRGDTASQAALLERAAALVLGGAGHGSAMEAVLVYAHLLARVAGRTDEALLVLRDGLRVAEEEGHISGAWMIHAGFGVVLFQAGQLDDAASAFETSIRLADELKTPLFVPSALAYLAYIDALRGNHEQAREHLVAAEEEAQRLSDSNVATDFDVLWARALIDELAGQDSEALEVLETLRRRAAEGAPHLLGAFVWFGISEVRVATRLGRRDLAEVAVGTLEQGVRPFRDAYPIEPWNSAFLSLCRGIAEGDVALLIDACDKLRPTTRRLLRATSCEEAGQLLVSHGQTDEAIPLLEEARALWSAAGAAHKERELGRHLRALGIRGIYRAGGRPRRGWEALTPTELRVAKLIAQGLTYRSIGERLFISKRTVETHAEHIFTKLGVGSRFQFTAEAAHHDFGRGD